MKPLKQRLKTPTLVLLSALAAAVLVPRAAGAGTALLLARLDPAPAAAERPDEARLRFARSVDLERRMQRIDYQWPPRQAVPLVEVETLPHDLAELPVARKKALFFRSLLPIVLAENRRLREERAFLQRALAAREALGPAGRERLAELQQRYRVEGDLDDPDRRARLLRRVDELPPALVLAQAANESGWGTSRFAREANNLFGMWTYDADLGLVPADRDADARHRVRAYDHLRASVRHYLLTLNRLGAYAELRRLRQAQRRAGGGLDAVELAQGLLPYSERGADYVAEIRSMIRHNRLQRLDQVRLQG